MRTEQATKGNNDEHSTVTRRAATKPRATPAHCPTCREQARVLHARTHLSVEAQTQIRETERAYEALELDFQRERDAERAALGRGEQAMQAQWHLDHHRLPNNPRVHEPAPKAVVVPATLTMVRVDKPLMVYRDLWHQETA